MSVARALYAFEGSETGDLSFQEDDIIRILRKDESGWWEGQTDDGRRGDFPYNYVELIDPKEVEGIRQASRLVSSPQRTVAGAQGQLDTVRVVKVTPVPKTAQFTVEAMLSRKKVSAVKSMEHFRNLDENIRYLYPNFDRPLPPYWSDKVYESETASKKRAKVLQIYIQKLVGNRNDVTEWAVISWMNPRESFTASAEAMQSVREAQKSSARNGMGTNSYNIAMANAFPLARAEFDWNATDAVELPLQKGTLVAVRNQSTSSAGWWEGETSDGQRGLFPANYVKMLDQKEARDVVLGQQQRATLKNNPAMNPMPGGGFNPFSQPGFMSPGGSSRTAAAPSLVAKAKTPVGSKRQRKTENNFAMPSLDAFDELLIEGFTMLARNKVLVPNPNAQSPAEGDRVTLSYTAYVWDCQKQRIIEFASSDLPDQRNFVGPLEFNIGKGETIKALERAVQNLEIGQDCRIIVRPDLGYGDVGNPPNVPPNCHLVYDVKLEGFQGAAVPGPPPMGNIPQTKMGSARGPSRVERPSNQFANTPSGSRYIPQGAVPAFPTGPTAPKNLAEAVAFRAVQNNESRGYNSNAPIEPRAKRPPNQTKMKVIRNNGPSRRQQDEKKYTAKYDLATMKVIVENKSYTQNGVNPLFLEDQLTDAAFSEAFHCKRSDFLLMARWKQKKLKKDAGLY